MLRAIFRHSSIFSPIHLCMLTASSMLISTSTSHSRWMFVVPSRPISGPRRPSARLCVICRGVGHRSEKKDTESSWRGVMPPHTPFEWTTLKKGLRVKSNLIRSGRFLVVISETPSQTRIAIVARALLACTSRTLSSPVPVRQGAGWLAVRRCVPRAGLSQHVALGLWLGRCRRSHSRASLTHCSQADPRTDSTPPAARRRTQEMQGVVSNVCARPERHSSGGTSLGATRACRRTAGASCATASPARTRTPRGRRPSRRSAWP